MRPRGCLDHRRLAIKAVGPQGLKAGLFLPITAKIDGQNAVLQTSQDARLFHIKISSVAGVISRGNQLVELTYTAEYQFAIYDDFEDLNQDVSGEWLVDIDKADVTLSLPEGLPADFGISADTGTDSAFRFDCIRTVLRSGVRFETTHPLSPGDRLFVSARFPHPGYFVSDSRKDGLRAVLQNHPLLPAQLAFTCGVAVFAGIAFAIWRHLPKRSAVAPIQEAALPNFWREVANIYRFPIIMFGLAIVPVLNFAYSGHGGIGWFFLPFCFPWVIAKMLLKIAKSPEALNAWYNRFFRVTVSTYLVLAVPLSWAAAASIRASFGLPLSTWSFYSIVASPFPWWFFTR